MASPAFWVAEEEVEFTVLQGCADSRCDAKCCSDSKYGSLRRNVGADGCANSEDDCDEREKEHRLKEAGVGMRDEAGHLGEGDDNSWGDEEPSSISKPVDRGHRAGEEQMERG